MFKHTLWAAVVALNLSHVPVEGLIQNAHGKDSTRMVDNNPFSGASSISVDLTRDEWYTQKEPVPYYELWDNKINQTAQQMVGICYLLQAEAGLYCEIPSMGYPVRK